MKVLSIGLIVTSILIAGTQCVCQRKYPWNGKEPTEGAEYQCGDLGDPHFHLYDHPSQDFFGHFKLETRGKQYKMHQDAARRRVKCCEFKADLTAKFNNAMRTPGTTIEPCLLCMSQMAKQNICAGHWNKCTNKNQRRRQRRRGN